MMTGWMQRLFRTECHRVQQVMDAWLDGELPVDQAHRVAAHLADCERCGIEADTYRRVKASLAALAPDLRPPADPDALDRLRRFAEDLTTSE